MLTAPSRHPISDYSTMIILKQDIQTVRHNKIFSAVIIRSLSGAVLKTFICPSCPDSSRYERGNFKFTLRLLGFPAIRYASFLSSYSLSLKYRKLVSTHTNTHTHSLTHANTFGLRSTVSERQNAPCYVGNPS